MDGSRFDSLTRVLGAPRSRRLVTTGLLALLSRAAWADPLVAKPKRKKKKKRAAVPPAAPPPCASGQKFCNGACIPATQCCGDSDCLNASLPRCCDGICQPLTFCCLNAHCNGGKTCQANVCACPSGQPECGGICKACAGQTALNPNTCQCCARPGGICAGGGCCLGTCAPLAGLCSGNSGGPCAFPGQCPIGEDCINGNCV